MRPEAEIRRAIRTLEDRVPVIRDELDRGAIMCARAALLWAVGDEPEPAEAGSFTHVLAVFQEAEQRCAEIDAKFLAAVNKWKA